MPKVTVTVPHSMSAQEALAKAQPGLDKTVRDFQGHDLVTTPSGDSASFKFKSMAFTISGSVRATDKEVVVEIDLPFAAMMFKGKTQKAVTKNVTKALAGELRIE